MQSVYSRQFTPQTEKDFVVNGKQHVNFGSLCTPWSVFCCVCLVTQSCPTLCDPMDCSLPGSSIYGILQARILEWAATLSSRGSSQPREYTQISRIAGGFFTIWGTREATWSTWKVIIFAEKTVLKGWGCLWPSTEACLGRGSELGQHGAHTRSSLRSPL